MRNFLRFFLLPLLLLLVGLTIRTLYKAGFFKKTGPFTYLPHTIIEGMPGAEDIVVDPRTGKACVSSCDRRRAMEGELNTGAIYELDFLSEPPVFRNLTAGTMPPDFRPHGISLFFDNTDSSTWLFVINHGDAGNTVELFERVGEQLLHRETVTGAFLKSPNDIAAAGRRQFYFTNDHDAHGAVSHWKDFLLIGTGELVWFDGDSATVIDSGIRYANGIALGPDGTHLYVAVTTDNSIRAYRRQPFAFLGTIPLGTGVDNLDFDEQGRLWAAAHPKMLRFLAHAKDAAKRSPSQVLQISLKTPSTADVQEVMLNNGEPLSGSSVAVWYRGHLLIGSVFDDGVLHAELDGDR